MFGLLSLMYCLVYIKGETGPMLKILCVLFVSLGIGGALASTAIPWPVRPGYLGGGLLIVASLLARAYWERRAREAGDDPGAPERAVWHELAVTALLCAFGIVTLLHPGSELHTRTGDTGGWDSWTMILGAVISYSLLRNRDAQSDERDRAIAALGNRAGYASLIALLVALLLALGFAPRPFLARATHWLLANVLVMLILLSALARQAAMLLAYWRGASESERS